MSISNRIYDDSEAGVFEFLSDHTNHTIDNSWKITRKVPGTWQCDGYLLDDSKITIMIYMAGYPYVASNGPRPYNEFEEIYHEKR